MSTFLENFTSATALDAPTKENTNFKHVFLDMLNFYSKDITKTDYMSLIYFFSTFEKCIKYLKNREAHTADAYLVNLHSSDIDCGGQNLIATSAISLSIYADAYKHYIENRREDAYRLVKKAISTLSEQNKDFPFYSLSLYDLYIRCYPILVKTESEEDIVNTFSSIIGNLLAQPGSSGDTSQELSGLDKQQRTAWLFYMLENLVYYTNEEYLASGKDRKHFYSCLLKGVVGQNEDAPWANQDVTDILNGLKVIYRYSSEKNINLDEELSCNYRSIIHCPEFLKQLMLIFYKEYSEEHSLPLADHPNFQNFSKVLETYKVPAITLN